MTYESAERADYQALKEQIERAIGIFEARTMWGGKTKDLIEALTDTLDDHYHEDIKRTEEPASPCHKDFQSFHDAREA